MSLDTLCRMILFLLLIRIILSLTWNWYSYLNFSQTVAAAGLLLLPVPRHGHLRHSRLARLKEGKIIGVSREIKSLSDTLMQFAPLPYMTQFAASEMPAACRGPAAGEVSLRIIDWPKWRNLINIPGPTSDSSSYYKKLSTRYVCHVWLGWLRRKFRSYLDNVRHDEVVFLVSKVNARN